MKAVKKSIVCVLALILLWPAVVLADTAPATTPPTEETGNVEVGNIRENDYAAYLEKYSSQPHPNKQIDMLPSGAFLQDEAFARQEGTLPIGTFEGQSALVLNEDNRVAWEVTVAETGLYNLVATYYPFAEYTYNTDEGQVTLKSKSSAISRAVYIDGELPFFSARQINLSRVWADASEIKTNEATGNQIRPFQVEKPIWQTTALRDHLGFYNEPFQFFLTKGTHTISLVPSREAFALAKLSFTQAAAARSYADITAGYEAAGYTAVPNNDQTFIKIQAENAAYKSDPTLYARADRTSPLTEPYSPSKIRLNTIGGDKWQNPNTWVEYAFNVTVPGLYQITLKAKQNVLGGTNSYRRLLVDGQEFSQETQAISFPYSTDWNNFVLGGETPYLVYFSAGQHTLRLETTLGAMSDIISQTEEIVYQFNVAYRRIIMLTGSSPDVNKSYQFLKNIPDAFENIHSQNAALKKIQAQLIALNQGKNSEQLTVINKMILITDIIDRNPDLILDSFTEFKDTIAALSTWINTVRMQPLTMDYLIVSSPSVELPRAQANFGEMFMHEINSFIASFFEDYDNIGGTQTTKDAVVVWVETGAGQAGNRDSANVLKQIIDEKFTPESGISVSLRLVAGGSLLPATLAGNGPDICLSRGSSDPVNFALRGAVQNLNDDELFPDHNEVYAQFKDSAMLPLRFRDGVYGLPETQDFLMMFYRADILQELNLEVPETWGDVYKMLPTLQNKNMNFGMPVPVQGLIGVAVPGYTMLLYQNGGRLYTPDENWQYDGVGSALTEPAALDAFKMWTNLFVVYQMPNSYDLATRFRSGEMPIAIGGYGLFNLFSVYAPEIDGLWSFTKVPGTVQQDGSINHASSGGVTACIMMSTARNKQNAWSFMKWWVGSQAQSLFGRELEAMLGSAARYQTANVEALGTLPWNREFYNALMEQWDSVVGIPEIPGSYYLPRNLEFAWKTVINTKADPFITLLDYSRVINEEITRKRNEFKDKLNVMP